VLKGRQKTESPFFHGDNPEKLWLEDAISPSLPILLRLLKLQQCKNNEEFVRRMYIVIRFRDFHIARVASCRRDADLAVRSIQNEEYSIKYRLQIMCRTL